MDDASGEIFISYKSERRRAAEHLAETLRRYGYTVWFDYQLVKGRNFALQIDARIRAARALIVLWCTLSVRSEWVHEEVDLAKRLGILIPAKIDDCELPAGNRLLDYIDLADWDGSPRSHQLDGLLAAIAAKVGRDPQPNFRALQEYDAIWRRFRALPLRAFALEAPLEARQGPRPLPEPAATVPPVAHAPSVVRTPTAAERYRAEGRIEVDCPANLVHGAPDGWFKPGAGTMEWFRDIDVGPEMVVIPAGEFSMGASYDDKGKPRHRVIIKAPFTVARVAVSPSPNGMPRGWRTGREMRAGVVGSGRSLTCPGGTPLLTCDGSRRRPAKPIGCCQRLSGSTAAGPVPPQRFGGASRSQVRGTSRAKRFRSIASSQTRGAFIRGTATSGSGARTTGTRTIKVPLRTAPSGSAAIRLGAFCAVGLGASSSTAPAAATRIVSATASALWVCVLPERSNTLRLYVLTR